MPICGPRERGKALTETPFQVPTRNRGGELPFSAFGNERYGRSPRRALKGTVSHATPRLHRARDPHGRRAQTPERPRARPPRHLPPHASPSPLELLPHGGDCSAAAAAAERARPPQPSPAQPSPAAERHCGRPAGRAGRGRGSPGPPRPARRRCRSPGGGLPTAPPTPPPSSFPPFGGAREGISPPSRGAVVTRQAAAGGSPRAFPGLFFFFGAGRLGVFAFPRPCRGDGCAQGLVKEFAFQRTWEENLN